MSGSEAVSIARKAFKSGRTLPVEWRIKQLKAMQRMVEENEVKSARFHEKNMEEAFCPIHTTLQN